MMSVSVKKFATASRTHSDSHHFRRLQQVSQVVSAPTKRLFPRNPSLTAMMLGKFTTTRVQADIIQVLNANSAC